MIDHSKRLLLRVSSPAEEPVSLAEAKLYLRITDSAEDVLVALLITAAREHAEEYVRRSLITQSWKLAFDDAAPEETVLPRGPILAITSVTAFNRAGDSTVISPANYTLDAPRDALVFDARVNAHRVEIVYSAGYGAAANVPASLRLGMLSHIAALYEHRGDAQVKIPAETLALFAPFREVRL